MFNLDQEQINSMKQNLVSFVCRVATDKNASPAELEALPKIVKVLCGMNMRL